MRWKSLTAALLVLAVPALAQIQFGGGSAPLSNGSVTGIMKGDGTTITCAAGVCTATTGGSAGISQLTGDVTAGPGSGSQAATLAATAVTAGSYGSSTSIPNFTVDAKGRLTAAAGNAVIAPAGTLSGATLASGVTASSLTSVGTLTALTVSGTTTLSGITGSTQCLHVNTSGVLSGTGSDCGSGGGGGLTVGSTGITSGTTNRLLYDNAGVLGESALTAGSANLLVTAPATISSTVASNAQSGASYTIASSDATKVVERTYTGGAMTDTLPNVSTTGFGAGFGFVLCTGPVTSAQQDTISVTAPSSISYNGNSLATSVVVPANSCLRVADADGTNYVAEGPFGTVAQQMANGVAITGGTINNTAIGGTTAAAATFSTLTDSGITGSTQCLHVNTSGVVSGTGSDCGSGGGSGLTVGSTGITGGTNTRVLYDNSGVLGEYAVTGSGNAVLATSPTLTTPVIGAATGTSLSVSGQLTSTVSTGTAPLVVSSTTNVANLNASSLSGATFAAPGAIGGGTAAAANFTTLGASSTVTFSGITGSTQCLHVNTSGVVSGTGSDCGSGGGAVSSVSNSDGTLTISPTTGAVVASLPSGATISGKKSLVYVICDAANTNGGTAVTSVSSGTSETVLYACKIAANSMGATGMLRLTFYATRSSSTNSDTWRIRFGTTNSTGGTQCVSQIQALSTNAGIAAIGWPLMNLNATGSQACLSSFNNFPGGLSSTSFTQPTIDTTGATYLIITGQPGTSGDTLTIVTASVELIPAGAN